MADTGKRAADWLRAVAAMVEEKSAAYGDSVGDPIRVFSKSEQTEGIRVRIDDKLSRIARGKAAGEDVFKDLVGYVALLAVCDTKQVQEEPVCGNCNGTGDCLCYLCAGTCRYCNGTGRGGNHPRTGRND